MAQSISFLKQRRNLTTGTTPAATELKARRALEQVVDRMGYQHAMSHVAAVDVMDPLISASQRTYFATAVQLQLIRSVPDITTQIFLTDDLQLQNVCVGKTTLSSFTMDCVSGGESLIRLWTSLSRSWPSTKSLSQRWTVRLLRLAF